MPSRAYRGKLPKPNAKGDWRPEVGGRRFTIGNKYQDSEGEALRRLAAIRDLFDQQCERHETDRWEPWLLRFALRLAKGDRTVEWEVSQYSKQDADDAAHEAMLLDELSILGLDIRTDDPATLAQGRKRVREWLNNQVQVAVSKAIEEAKTELLERYGPIASNMTRPMTHPECYETKTFHAALDAYSLSLKKTGDKNAAGDLKTGVLKSVDRVRYLKDHHDDMPLWQLNLPVLEEHAAYWRNRPKTLKTNRCSVDFARDMNKELRRFLKWLNESPSFDWHLPHGFDGIKRAPIKFSQDEIDEPFQTVTKATYTPAELADILKHTDRFGKVLIALCVNCAFGQSEVGQWATSKFSLHRPHPHAEKVGFISTAADSWITGNRPKTRCYGEHLLWPEVATSLAPFLDGRKVLPLTLTGKPWYRTHSKNPQAHFGNWFGKLLDCVEKSNPGFRRLPFGSLRDVLPNVLRQEYTDEIARVCLQHQTPSDDDLLKCYANLPFKRLFEATRDLHDHFKPMLDLLPS